jgi:hypothetical protein
VLLGEARRAAANAISDRSVIAIAVRIAVTVSWLRRGLAGESERSSACEQNKMFHSASERIAYDMNER